MVTFLLKLRSDAYQERYRLKLLLWSKLILWGCSEYQDTPAEMDDFQLLPNDEGWQDTIHFKDEGHGCSILKIWVPSCTYFLRNILRDFRELTQRGCHIQLMELPLSFICWVGVVVGRNIKD